MDQLYQDLNYKDHHLNLPYDDLTNILQMRKPSPFVVCLNELGDILINKPFDLLILFYTIAFCSVEDAAQIAIIISISSMTSPVLMFGRSYYFKTIFLSEGNRQYAKGYGINCSSVVISSVASFSILAVLVFFITYSLDIRISGIYFTGCILGLSKVLSDKNLPIAYGSGNALNLITLAVKLVFLIFLFSPNSTFNYIPYGLILVNCTIFLLFSIHRIYFSQIQKPSHSMRLLISTLANTAISQYSQSYKFAFESIVVGAYVSLPIAFAPMVIDSYQLVLFYLFIKVSQFVQLFFSPFARASAYAFTLAYNCENISGIRALIFYNSKLIKAYTRITEKSKHMWIKYRFCILLFFVLSGCTFTSLISNKYLQALLDKYLARSNLDSINPVYYILIAAVILLTLLSVQISSYLSYSYLSVRRSWILVLLPSLAGITTVFTLIGLAYYTDNPIFIYISQLSSELVIASMCIYRLNIRY